MGNDCYYALATIVSECGIQGWDGHDSEPVLPETYHHACCLVRALPPGVPAPSVGIEADGHITLEWYRNPSRVLSVSVSPDGLLHYAALLGAARRRNGTEPFLGSVPDAILSAIREVYAA